MTDRRPTSRRPLGEVVAGLIAPVAEKLDRTAGWDRLPPKLGVATLLGLRHRLRERNLYDTGQTPAACEADRLAGPSGAVRTLDGSGNDPADPRMGAARTRFGRNAPPVAEDEVTFQRPDALEVSRQLLVRDEFFPAEELNLLAAAWVQFEVHDWFSHQTNPSDASWAERRASSRSKSSDPSEPPPLKTDNAVKGRYRAFLSDQTHWWDASQLYGARKEFAEAMRRGEAGEVKVDGELLEAMEPFMDTSAADTSAPVPNLWIGTALLHILFAKEHNAICARLHDEYPGWGDDRLYGNARLINAAVMAKIHTVEWTPAVIAHPASQAGIIATWWGVLGEPIHRRFGRIGPGEVLSGIPGSRPEHDGAPYALTEEFVAVYRMHQLIPDDVAFGRIGDGATIEKSPFEDLVIRRPSDQQARRGERKQQFDHWLGTIGPANALYSLANAHPGEITLHNYPAFSHKIKQFDGLGTLDLGEVDIRRTRETGVPRYNNFRRLFRLKPARNFHEIANGNPAWAKEIRDVYDDKLEDVDLLIGLFAERKPQGFAFSDTAFRVFLLMAARRLRSDRFFTTDYTPEIYTRLGLRWIDDATFAGVLHRHYPELANVLPQGGNPFRPWRR
jgi:hypothetical protein